MRLTEDEINLIRKHRENKLTEYEIEWVRKHRKNVTTLRDGLIGLFLALIVGAVGYFSIPYIYLWNLLIATIVVIGIYLIISDNFANSKSILNFFIAFSIIFMLVDASFAILTHQACLNAFYNVSIKVFYPNHPNLTITQHCTPFRATNYFNSEPTDNVTTCILPQEDNDTGTCYITNTKIECYYYHLYKGTFDIWEGQILNVSDER